MSAPNCDDLYRRGCMSVGTKLGNPWCFPLYEPLSDDNVLSVPCAGDKSTLSNFKGQFQSLF